MGVAVEVGQIVQRHGHIRQIRLGRCLGQLPTDTQRLLVFLLGCLEVVGVSVEVGQIVQRRGHIRQVSLLSEIGQHFQISLRRLFELIVLLKKLCLTENQTCQVEGSIAWAGKRHRLPVKVDALLHPSDIRLGSGQQLYAQHYLLNRYSLLIIDSRCQIGPPLGFGYQFVFAQQGKCFLKFAFRGVILRLSHLFVIRVVNGNPHDGLRNGKEFLLHLLQFLPFPFQGCIQSQTHRTLSRLQALLQFGHIVEQFLVRLVTVRQRHLGNLADRLPIQQYSGIIQRHPCRGGDALPLDKVEEKIALHGLDASVRGRVAFIIDLGELIPEHLQLWCDAFWRTIFEINSKARQASVRVFLLVGGIQFLLRVFPQFVPKQDYTLVAILQLTVVFILTPTIVGYRGVHKLPLHHLNMVTQTIQHMIYLVNIIIKMLPVIRQLIATGQKDLVNAICFLLHRDSFSNCKDT